MVGSNLANDNGFLPQWMRTHCTKDIIRIGRRDECKQLALIRNVERFESQSLACTLNRTGNGEPRLMDNNPSSCLLGDFVQCACYSTTGGISQYMDLRSGFEDAIHEIVKGAGIAGY